MCQFSNQRGKKKKNERTWLREKPRPIKRNIRGRRGSCGSTSSPNWKRDFKEELGRRLLVFQRVWPLVSRGSVLHRGSLRSEKE